MIAHRVLGIVGSISLALGVAACNTGGVESGASVSPTPDPSGTPTATPTGTATPAPGNAIRFVAIGDTGTASEDQYAVAAALQNKCGEDGCDFGVLLGDNFYNTGVTDVNDPQFESKFQIPYGGMTFPWYITLGNHDYGGDGAGYQFDRGAVQVAYSELHSNFLLPAEYYSWEEGPAMFLGLGTNLIFWNQAGAGIAEQGAYFTNVLNGATTPWRIALGHHPYRSNGPHGNAGNYEGLSWLPIVNGANVKQFFDETICGKVDLYLSGHDHSRQILPATPECDTTLVVSGAGAKVTDLPGTNPTDFQRATIGFTYVVVTEDRITIEMLDGAGQVEVTYELTH